MPVHLGSMKSIVLHVLLYSGITFADFGIGNLWVVGIFDREPSIQCVTTGFIKSPTGPIIDLMLFTSVTKTMLQNCCAKKKYLKSRISFSNADYLHPAAAPIYALLHEA